MLIKSVVDYKDFSQYLEKYKNVIVNISAPWCKPCKDIKPLIEKFLSVIDKDNIIYLKIEYDVYANEEEFDPHFSVKKIPYFGLLRDGEVVYSVVSGDFAEVSQNLHQRISMIPEDEKSVLFDIDKDF